MSDIDLKALRESCEACVRTDRRMPVANAWQVLSVFDRLDLEKRITTKAVQDLAEMFAARMKDAAALKAAERRAEEAEKERAGRLTHAQRIEGLTRDGLKNLKAQIDGAIAAIDAAGQVDAWAVSNPWQNLHWDTSYARAFLYLEKLLKKARTEGAEAEVYEITTQRLWAAEVPDYERDYGSQWAALQAELDAAIAQDAGAEHALKPAPRGVDVGVQGGAVVGPGSNSGHGHVWKRPDGLTAKCGGPRICAECRSYALIFPGCDVAMAQEGGK